MSTPYGGLAANVVAPGAVSIASSNNANPLVITTSTPHGLLTGDIVTIAGHLNNPPANVADVVATPISTTTFSIPFAGSGTGSGGIVSLVSRGAAGIQTADGADPMNAALLNGFGMPPLDRTAALFSKLGYAKLAGRVVLINAFGPGNNWCHIASSLTTGTWNEFTVDSTLTQFAVGSTGSLGYETDPSAPNPAIYSFAEVYPGEQLHLTMETTAAMQTGDYVGLLYAITSFGVAAPSFPSGFTLVPGSSRKAGSTSNIPVRCSGWVVAGVAGTLYLAPGYYRAGSTGSVTAGLADDSILEIEAWRPTGWPQ